MLSRLRTSPWLRAALLVTGLGFCAYGLMAEWPQAHAALGRLHWYSVAAAALAAAAGAGCMMLAWRELLADLGSRLPLPAATRVIFVAQLARYVPGAVWTFAAQVELGRDHQVPGRRGATAVIVGLAVALGVGLLTAAATLPLSAASAARQYWWALAIAPVILLCLCPPVLGRMLDRALALAGRKPLERTPSWSGMAKAVGWTALGWLLWGLQAWVVIRDMTGGGTKVLLLALGGYALAWSAGVLAVPFPSGIGPRELALVAALAPVMPRGAALVVALTSRVVMTASDLAWAGVGLTIARPPARAATQPGTRSARAGRGRHRKITPGRTTLPGQDSGAGQAAGQAAQAAGQAGRTGQPGPVSPVR